jgi:hypothetical protein
VRIYQNKRLFFNSVAYQKINSLYIELLYNEELNLVGIRPLEKPLFNSYKIVENKKKNAWSISFYAFIEFFGLYDKVGKRFFLEEKDDLFYFDLNKPLR